jgi:DNA-binding CsgD family transcriptional regulator
MRSGTKTPTRTNGRRRANGRATQDAANDLALLEAIPDLLMHIDKNGRYLGYKPAKDFDTYVPPSQFLGRNLNDVLPGDIAELSMRHIRRALETRETQVYTYRLPKNGVDCFYEARVVALDGDAVLAIVRDLTAQLEQRRKAADPYRLSPRELSVLQLMADGRMDKEIAAELGIRPMTAQKHVAHILRKMGALSRTDASVRAVREGLVS